MAKTYEAIATSTLGSATNAITFSSIPGTYTDLRISIVGQATSATADMRLSFNGDRDANYSFSLLSGNTSTVTGSGASGQSWGWVGSMYASSTYWDAATVDIFSYTSSLYKTFIANCVADRSGGGVLRTFFNMWASTSSITSLTVHSNGDNYSADTQITLYGIKAA